MKLEIKGLLRGRDAGYSVRHPDRNHLDEFCCCENSHCHLPGETPEERHRYACLMIAASEMLELIQQVADLQNPRNYGAAYNDLVIEQDRLADLAQELLAKIEGGEA